MSRKSGRPVRAEGSQGSGTMKIRMGIGIRV